MQIDAIVESMLLIVESQNGLPELDGAESVLSGEKIMSKSVVTASDAVVLAGDQVLTIAQADAAGAYRDLSIYRIQLVLEDDGWHVDYELKNTRLKGGGPHYLIDPHSGVIVSKRYEQ